MPIKPFVAVTALFLFLNKTLAQEVVDEYNYNQNIELTNKGWELVQKEDNEQAIQKFTQAIVLYDGNTDSFSGIATAYFKTKKYDSASYFVVKALEISPDEADLHYLAGNINIRLENYNQAITHYSKAIRNNSSSNVKVDIANCYFNRGNAFLFIEKYEKSILDFTSSILINPMANTYHNRAIAYKNLNQPQDACNNFQEAFNRGSEQSEKFLLNYCQSFKPKKIVEPKNHTNLALEINETFSDTISTTLYYDNSWRLTNKFNSVSYRKAQIRTSDLKFVGPFVDYYPDGKVLVQGQYDSLGNKTGLFERFHENGKLYSKGNFKSNIQVGKWTYYYDNGNVKEKILFNGNHFIVIESYGKDGIIKVEKGTGIWTYKFVVSITESYQLHAPVNNGLRIGDWELKNQNEQVILIESYENGMFKAGKQGNPGFMKPYNQTQFTSGLFYPSSYQSIESFAHDEIVTTSDYPFLNHLPNRSELKSISGAYLNADNDSIIDHDKVEESPIPPGGLPAFYKYVGKNMDYPNQARRAGIEGRVFVQFVVNTDGSILDVRTLKGIGGGCDEEAERVIRNAPSWTPGTLNGKPVKVRMILPLTFKLSEPVNKPFRMKDRPYSRF